MRAKDNHPKSISLAADSIFVVTGKTSPYAKGAGGKAKPIPEEEGEDEEDEYERAWPERAFHPETSFGYPLESGEHRLCACLRARFSVTALTRTLLSKDRYNFMMEPDKSVMPEYRQARPGDGDSYW